MVFPDPFGPTIPISFPAGSLKSISHNPSFDAIIANSNLFFQCSKEIVFVCNSLLYSLNIFLINNCNDAFIRNNIHEPEISINVIKEELNCIIIITDNAKGIHKDIINRIFEPYFTTKDKYHGTGLGLYMVQSLLTRQLKGDIKVENIKNKDIEENFHGASFKLSIPINI